MPRKIPLNVVKSKNNPLKVRKGKSYRFARRHCAEDEVIIHNLGPLDNVCQNCGGKHFNKEKVGQHCCHNGKINSDICPDIIMPSDLIDLYNGSSELSSNFLANIRSYNNALAFASLKLNIQNFSRGPKCFKIYGQTYHCVSDLHPESEEIPSYAALFILDEELALQYRISNVANVQLNVDLLSKLQTMLFAVNPYAKLFFSMKEYEENQLLHNDVIPNYQLVFHNDNIFDKRRYNAPQTSEIAVSFMADSDGRPPSNIDFVMYSREKGLQTISGLNPHVDPMIYPLLFPAGDPGWKSGISHSSIFSSPKNNTTTQLQFYCYRLRIFDGNFILKAGKLLQQYIVDAYVRVETSRLTYIRQHQKELRIESYSGLRDFVNETAKEAGMKAGTPIVLPSTFIGSPRNMHQNFQDAMCIVSKFGKPDLFITMTANPNWQEIKENLDCGETAINRPDIVCRVFSLKLQSLMEDVVENEIFGKIVAYVYVIEFQKRGLPHAHILIILDKNDKIRNVEDVDEIVCAEIPDSSNERLFNLVTKFMIHGPCDVENVGAICRENGKCIRGFPKDFVPETVENQNGYPLYKRRKFEDRSSVFVRGHQIDNRWVVPYNAYLLLKYDAHINVEICSSVKSVKYLFKYVYKGYDSALLHLRNCDNEPEIRLDEVSKFINTRYVSSSEGIWRLNERIMHKRSHAIERLCVHLENEEPVVFEEGMEEFVVNSRTRKDSKLVAWLKLNRSDISARNVLYKDIPEHYVWSNGKWNKRKINRKNIGRMFTVNPCDTERFYLRILLLHVCGATSFEDIRTVNGVVHQTFEDTAKALKLLESNEEWYECLLELSLNQMPSQMRQLFAYICIFNRPTDPYSLWMSFREYLCEDYLRMYTDEQSFNMGLNDLNDIFSLHNCNCLTFNLPEITLQIEECTVPILNEEYENLHNIYYDGLNVEQKHIVDEILSNVENGIGGLYFVDGPGGSGKTFLYVALCCLLRGRSKNVVPVAWTGIAANLLPGGRTAHSVFKFPIPLFNDSTCKISYNSKNAKILRNADLIIWDEISMTPASALTVVDSLLRDLTNNDEVFGGKLIVLGGDFRQILPVVMHGTRSSIVENCVKNSVLWSLCNVRKLEKNMRTAEDEIIFADWLKKLGEGQLEQWNEFGTNLIKLPSTCIVKNDIVEEIYGCELTYDSIEHFFNTCILCPKNEHCLVVNERVLNRLVGDEKNYYSIDTILSGEDDIMAESFSLEFLNSLELSSLPSHILKLKRGAIVILLRNLNPKLGLVNGTRLVIVKLHDHCLECQIITGDFRGENVFIPRIKLTSNDQNLPFILQRQQFPIKIAFAMTINKSQGQTFDKVGLYLEDPVFSHGQLYVAFSRVRKLDNVKIAITGGIEKHVVNNSMEYFTKNIVYNEIL